MQLPGIVSLTFLTYLLLVIPLGARRTAARLRRQDPAHPPPSRERYWRSAIFVQLILFFLAWFTGSGFGFQIFHVDGITWSHAAYALVALLLSFALREISRRWRTEEELRNLSVFERAARTPREVTLFTVAVVAAGVAEEAAYRGVAWSILIYMFGDPWSTALILSIAFAVAHWNQGWKSGITIVVLAFLLHGTVALTGTLVLAMAVHISYDLIAGRSIRNRAREFDRVIA